MSQVHVESFEASYHAEADKVVIDLGLTDGQHFAAALSYEVASELLTELASAVMDADRDHGGLDD